MLSTLYYQNIIIGQYVLFFFIKEKNTPKCVYFNGVHEGKNFFYDLYKYNMLKCFKLSYLFLKSLKDFNIVPILRPPLIEFILHKMQKMPIPNTRIGVFYTFLSFPDLANEIRVVFCLAVPT